MESTKLLKLISTLNGHEQNRFKKFLFSPYFNQLELPQKFFTEVMKLLAHQMPLVKEELWKQMFGKQIYRDVKFRRICSDTLKLLEKFLAYREIEKDELQLHLHLLQGIQQKNLQSFFPNHYKLIAKHHQLKPNAGADDFYNHFRLEALHNVHLEKQFSRQQPLRVKEAMQHLDHFYWLNKLRYSCAMLHYSRISGVQPEISFLNELSSFLSSQKKLPPAILIYHQVLLTMQHPHNQKYFEKLKEGLNEWLQHLDKGTAQELLVFSINYCVRGINSGKLNFLKEVFDLYKLALNFQVLHNNKILSPWDYKNITVTALRLGEDIWAEKFIEKYKNDLPKEERQNAHIYNLAKLNFYRGNFEKVMQQLQKVEYTDPFYILDSKTMLLKTYFELDELESLDSLVHSFRMLLKRKKLISDEHRANYLHMVNFIKRLSRKKIKGTELKLIRKEIETASHLADKNWLLQKVKELE